MPIARVFARLLAAFTASSLVILCLITLLRRKDLWPGYRSTHTYTQRLRDIHPDYLLGSPPERPILLHSLQDNLKRSAYLAGGLDPYPDEIPLEQTPGPIATVLDSLLKQTPRLPSTPLPLTTWSPNQKIDVTGIHRFIPPGPTDLRGPCPGLNALSNHGYLPRNGIVGLVQSALVVQDIFGIGIDLGVALGLYATLMVGDPMSQTWSIGGRYNTILEILFGKARGLSGSHNIYESDGSVTAGDFYLFNGDIDTFQPSKLRALLDLQKTIPISSQNFDLPILTQHRNYTLLKGISGNPFFFMSPFAGLLVSNAGHAFVPALMSNYTQAKPAGVLNEPMLLDWYAMNKDPSAPFGLRSRGKGWSAFGIGGPVECSTTTVP